MMRDGLEAGNFFKPTVLTNVRDDMTVIREEVFGPVLPVLTYADPEELSVRANDTSYGLSVGIWTRDLATAHNLAAHIRAGSVFVNHPPVLDPAAPWGGWRTSGWGQEMGSRAIDTYTETKAVWVNLG